MIGLVALALLATAAAAPGPDAPDASPSAARANALGAVTGRVHASETPGGTSKPLPGTSLVLVPRSESFLSDVEAIKRQARDSLARYRTSIGEVRGLRDAYVKSLRDASAADRVRAVTVDAEGRFAIPDVPVGAWLLVGEHATVVKTKTPRPPKANPKTSGKGAGGTYLPHEEFLGYQSVTIWIAELSIESDRTEVVDLTDRNGWFAGINERTTPAPTHGAGSRGR